MSSVIHGERLLSAEEFARLPDDGMRRELVRGKVVEMSPAGGQHGVVGNRLYAPLTTHVAAGKLGEVFLSGTGYRLSRDPDVVRAPDISFVSSERMPRPVPVGFLDLAPDLAVEVISPGDSYREVQEKVEEYLAAGTREVWLVDPGLRRVELRLPGERPLFLHEDAVIESDLLPGFALSVRGIFKTGQLHVGAELGTLELVPPAAHRVIEDFGLLRERLRNPMGLKRAFDRVRKEEEIHGRASVEAYRELAGVLVRVVDWGASPESFGEFSAGFREKLALLSASRRCRGPRRVSLATRMGPPDFHQLGATLGATLLEASHVRESRGARQARRMCLVARPVSSS